MEILNLARNEAIGPSESPRPKPDFLPFKVHVSNVNCEGNESLQIRFRWEDKDKELIRSRSEPMAKSLTKLASSLAGKKKNKNKKKAGAVNGNGTNFRPSEGEIAALRRQAAEGASSAPEGVRVVGPEGQTVDPTLVTNAEGWTTGTTIHLEEELQISFTVVKDAPEVEAITTFPGEITKGGKLKSTGLMVGYPAIVQASTRNTSHITYLWEYQQGAEGYVYAGEGAFFWPQREHIGLKLKVFATPHDKRRGISGRSAVCYLTGVVKEPATAGILTCRASYLAIRGKGRCEDKDEDDSKAALASHNAEGQAEPALHSVGKDFMPLFSEDTVGCTDIHVPESLSNASGYLQLGQRGKLPAPVRLCTNPLLCTEEHATLARGEGEGTQSDELRVVSFNILADCYCGGDYAITQLFGYCDPAYLALDYRLQLVGAELEAYDADIVCLQEVDKRAYSAFLCPFMTARGYSGHFTAKHTAVNEGCATFTKQELEVCLRVDLALGQSMEECGLFDESFDRLPHAREILVEYLGMIGQVTVVRHRSSEGGGGAGRYVVVGNTHEFYHPRAAYARLLQTFVLTRILGAVAQAVQSRGLAGFSYPGATVVMNSSIEQEQEQESGQPKVSVIFLGDLNSTLETAVVEYLETGRIESHHRVWQSVDQFDWHRERGIGYGEDDEDEDEAHVIYPWPELVNPLGAMKSAAGYPQFTNFTAGFKDVLDYIFVPSSGAYAHLQPVRIAPMPTEARLARDGAIPSSSFPSDHVALAVDLAW